MGIERLKDRRIVLTIIDPFDPLGNKIGGAETYLKGLIKYAPDNFDIYFIGISADRRRRPIKKWTRLKIGDRAFYFYPLFYVEDENKKKKIPISLQFVTSFLLNKPKIIMGCLFFNRIESVLPFVKKKIPKVLVVHNDIRKQIFQKNGEVYWSKFPKAYFMFEKYVLPSIDVIFTVTGETVSYFKKTYPDLDDRMSFLPTSVDTTIYTPAREPSVHLRKRIESIHGLKPTNEKWVVFVGRIQKQKSPFRMIDSFIMYQEKYRNASLMIIGDGDMKPPLKKYIDCTPFKDDIHFLGNIHQKRLCNYYRASDVLILTSDYEGMPLCVLEALACGIPVVSTDVGEVREIIQDNYSGEISKKNDPGSISQSLQKVLCAPEIYTKENCLNSVSEYSIKSVLNPLYLRIIDLFAGSFQNSSAV